MQSCQILSKEYGKCLSNLWQNFLKMTMLLATLIFRYLTIQFHPYFPIFLIRQLQKDLF